MGRSVPTIFTGQYNSVIGRANSSAMYSNELDDSARNAGSFQVLANHEDGLGQPPRAARTKPRVPPGGVSLSALEQEAGRPAAFLPSRDSTKGTRHVWLVQSANDPLFQAIAGG